MPRVKVLRPTVIQGRARAVGDVLDITSQDMRILGRRVEVIAAEVDVETAVEPETATNTTAMHASLVGEARTSRRK